MKEDILDSLCRAAEAIAIMFGKNCETVVHDLYQPDIPLVAIYNGHISGREVGSTLDIYGGEIAAGGIAQIQRGVDYVNNLVITNNGKHIKSTTINFVGEDYHYALGINFDLTALSAMELIIKDMLQTETELNSAIQADQTLDDIMDYCLSTVNKPIEKMNKTDRIKVVELLKERNMFSFQRAIPYVAKRLQVSRFTIYNYLNELNE